MNVITNPDDLAGTCPEPVRVLPAFSVAREREQREKVRTRRLSLLLWAALGLIVAAFGLVDEAKYKALAAPTYTEGSR
jgi:hypothetical protein